MNSTHASSMRQELEKIAKTRWQKEMEAGRLGGDELYRLPGSLATYDAARSRSSGFEHTPTADLRSLEHPRPLLERGGELTAREALHKVRDQMWLPSGTDLGGREALARHEQLAGHLGRADMERMGGYHFNMPGVGPATIRGRVFVNPNAGQFMRAAGRGDTTEAALLALNKKGLMPTEAMDPVLYRATVAHEGGERAAYLASRLKDEQKIPTRALASHYSEVPMLQEQLATFRHPEAAKQLWDLRGTNEGDKFLRDKIRQFGGRLDSPIPLGSNQHVALAKATAKAPPDLYALQRRAHEAMWGAGHGDNPLAAVAEAAKGSAEQLTEKHPHLGNAAQWALGKITPRVVAAPAKDPKNMGALLKTMVGRAYKR